MACLQRRTRATGTAWIVLFSLNKRRKSLFLSQKYTEKDARKVADVVDELVVAIETGAPLAKSSFAWLSSATDDLRHRFESAGLIEPDARLTLGELFDRYEREELDDKKETTVRNKLQAARRFFTFTSRDERVEDFDRLRAADYATWLSKRVAEATRAGAIRDVRRVFNWAKERELVDDNPFDNVVRGSFKNKTRERFVSLEDFDKMLDAAASQELRALLALYRVGGLRKEEALRVEWKDVNFAAGRLLVHSPKTERYKGRETRTIPLFPALRRELEDLFELVPPGGSPFVITRNRTTVRKKVEETVFRAGLVPWERLIQNLRSSRAIEIYREFGALAEAEWIGHSQRTAVDHYLHVLESDFQRAAAGDCRPLRGEVDNPVDRVHATEEKAQ